MRHPMKHGLTGSVFAALLLSILQPKAHSQTSSVAADSIETRMSACASCHGLHGEGTTDPFFPRLAGKPAGYLYNQLVAFRSGRRHYSPMNYLLEFQTDTYLHAMAEYFASQRPPFLAHNPAVVDSSVLARGKDLVTHGNVNRAIPACVGCHNPALTGMEPAIPGLLGLKPAYITAQLGAWRYGTRTAASPDCMQIVAGRLTEEDVTAVAAWLSSLPAPLNAVPVPHGSLTMPLVCGSEPK